MAQLVSMAIWQISAVISIGVIVVDVIIALHLVWVVKRSVWQGALEILHQQVEPCNRVATLSTIGEMGVGAGSADPIAFRGEQRSLHNVAHYLHPPPHLAQASYNQLVLVLQKLNCLEVTMATLKI